MTNWKENLQLRDLDDDQPIEVTCRRCGHSRYELASQLLQDEALKYAYLDEIEAGLRCSQRGCHGSVRIAITHNGETEGFMGGLA